MNTRTYPTGETNETLRNTYNPNGSHTRAVQLRLLEVLLYLQEVCNQLQIPFYLDGGTLLGAVRHGGFIPWDDDIDVVVDRKDYRRLVRYFRHHPHPDFILQDINTDPGYSLGWAKLRDRHSSSIYNGTDPFVINNTRASSLSGVSVDLFRYSDRVIPWINRCIHGFHYRITLRHLVGHYPRIARWATLLSLKLLAPLADFVGTLFSDRKVIYHDYCTYNTVYCFQKDRVYPLSTISFEGHLFSCPHDTDYYLRTLYGDYLSLPPERSRDHHHKTVTLFPKDHHA